MRPARLTPAPQSPPAASHPRTGRRGRPVQREHALQKAVAEYLEVALPPTYWFSSIDHSRRGPIEGKRLKDRGVKRGLPDIVILTDEVLRLDIWIELKVKGKKPSDEQIAFSLRAQRAGGKWLWARSVEEVEQKLRECGVPMRATLGRAA